MATSTDFYNNTVYIIQHPHWLESNRRPLTHGWHVAFAVVGICVFIGSTVGNLMVILLFVRFRCLRSFSNLFVLNLTVADFLLCVGNIPMFIIASFSGYWLFDVIGCQIYAFIGSVASFVSINTLAAIAVDRCMVIVRTFSLQNRTSRWNLYMSLALIWIYSLLWATGPLSGWGHFILEGTDTSCTFDYLTRNTNNRSYVIAIFTAHFIIPVTVISASYYLIFQAVRKQRREFARMTRIFGEEQIQFRVQNQKTGMKKELKTAKVSLIIILVFCISWFPYATIALIGVFGDQTLVTRLGAGIPCLCAKFSTIINPLMYALLHPKFRERLLNIGTCRKASEYEIQSASRRGTSQFYTVRKSSSKDKSVSSENGDAVSDSV